MAQGCCCCFFLLLSSLSKCPAGTLLPAAEKGKGAAWVCVGTVYAKDLGILVGSSANMDREVNKSHSELREGGWRLESLRGGAEADWIQIGQRSSPVRELKQRSE